MIMISLTIPTTISTVILANSVSVRLCHFWKRRLSSMRFI